jgi:hypothetical protein
MRHVVSAMLLVAAVIHLLPVPGVLGADRLAALYGIPIADPNLAILLRHRAVLFGVLGALLAAAAFIPSLQPAAFVAGFTSVVSFLVIARGVGGYNAQVARVFAADVVALVCLVIGLVAYVSSRRSG